MPVRIYPLSLALGLVFAVVCFIAMGQSTVQTPLRVEYVPHPRDYVQIKEGTPYTVPAGKLLTLTGIGSVDGSSHTLLRVNGTNEITALPLTSQSGGSSVVPVQPGFTIQPGATVEALSFAGSGTTTARAWGYLANQ